MEKNLAASFTREDQLVRAAEVLKEQGVLNMQANSYASLAEAESFAFHQLSNMSSGSDPEASYILHVYVEKSRYRQAEDTLTQYGGKLLQP